LSGNQLALEKSPYLLQHKNNPVAWYAWGEEAFQAAKEQNKPIFLSIGYSTCYWCHVMEKDSFESLEVAQALNEDFIAIKVDREERPDVDQIYMETVIALTGHGGWPMSVFLTPDLKPFWGGTFFYKQQFIAILSQVAVAWKRESSNVISSADKLVTYLSQKISTSSDAQFDSKLFDVALKQYQERFDPIYGGFGEAPKFPPSMAIGFLLREGHFSKSQPVLTMLEATLIAMAKGGIYDQIGGGFHRYSTDNQWLVPHFEKMLYDNALLAKTYTDAYLLTKNDNFSLIAKETLDYVLREMLLAEGGFASAQDAGEVGKEGEFFVWKAEELKTVFSENDFNAFRDIFSITEDGNFEHSTNVLYLDKLLPIERAKRKDLSSQLLNERNKRKAPLRDDKIITSWNALMITALAHAYKAFGSTQYLEAAQNAATFIKEKLYNGQVLFRRYCDGNTAIPGFCEDYAYLIEALFALYSADFNQDWLHWAKDLQQVLDFSFWDSEDGGYYYSTAKELVVNKKEIVDNATPASNAVCLHNLSMFKQIFSDSLYQERYQKLSAFYVGILEKHPSAFPVALQVLLENNIGRKELIIASDLPDTSVENLLNDLNQRYIPGLFVGIKETSHSMDSQLPDVFHGKSKLNEQATFYLCKNMSCSDPTNNPEEVCKSIF
jgi:uncharacterized protein